MFFLCLTFVLGAYESNTSLLFTLAKFYANSQQYDTAISKLEEVIKQDPANQKAVQLIEEYRNMRDNKVKPAGVIESGSQKNVPRDLTEYEKKLVSEHERKVAEYVEHEEFALAMTQLEKIISIVPFYGKPYYEMGIIFMRTGKEQEALKAFDECIARTPDSSYAWFYKGVMLLGLFNGEDGFKALEHAIEIDPDNLFFRLKTGQYYARNGDPVSGEKHLKEGIRINPRSDETLYALGELMLTRKNYDGAARFFTEQLKESPQNVRWLSG
ncbi:MAG: tetratricopeptide repeat protein, partial [Candidatus Wallbacteria bacterium]|nr:tetratricopeptide repeat protein [Candidatus Wallbacteria bacterium]